MTNWIILSYSLPSQSSSSPRVTLWRRLRRVGAISPTGGVNILPAKSECIEAFQWLAQEIQQAGGQALVMQAQQLDGLSDTQLVGIFQEARAEDYAALASQVAELEQATQSESSLGERGMLFDSLTWLRQQHADITRIDYFKSPAGEEVAERLTNIAHRLAGLNPEPEIPQAEPANYQERTWATRPQPFIDRLACAWLIHRYIDAQAIIRYTSQPEADEVTFDMAGAEFGHTGSLCTFETMLRAFDLTEPGLSTLAEIVHEIDLHDQRYMHPEISGLEAILQGWLGLNLSDADLEARGVAVFDGLFTDLSQRNLTQ